MIRPQLIYLEEGMVIQLYKHLGFSHQTRQEETQFGNQLR